METRERVTGRHRVRGAGARFGAAASCGVRSPYLAPAHRVALLDSCVPLASMRAWTARRSPGQLVLQTPVLLPRLPRAVLTTHHHYDHDGGNAYVANAVPSVRVFGADDERIDARTHTVAHGQIIKLGALRISVMDTSCHTQHHLSYLVHSSHSSVPDACFTGDALFVGGCGRLFEGTPAELYSALKALTSTLPKDTLLYPGHEYTISNLVFGAAHACSDDIQTGAIMRALERAQALRARNLPTVPTTVAAELESNVFVRAPTVDHLAALRAAKDTFPGL